MRVRVVGLLVLAMLFLFSSDSAFADLDPGYSCPFGFEPAYGMVANVQDSNSCYKCSDGKYDPFSGVCAIDCNFDSDTGSLECQGTSEPEIRPAILDSDKPYCVIGSEYPDNPFDINCRNMDTELECHPGPNILYNPFDIICEPIDDDDDGGGGGSDDSGGDVCTDDTGGVIDCPNEPECDICEVLENCALGIDALRRDLNFRLDRIIRKLDEIAALLSGGLGGGGDVTVEPSCQPLPADYGGGPLPPGDLPWCEARQIIDCPVLFQTNQNFVYHLVDVARNKFPLDVVTGGSWPSTALASSQQSNVKFFGETFSMRFFFDSINLLKIPFFLSFLIWCLVSL